MHAIIHTKGVVLNETYFPLELAYLDVTGLLCNFHITSPMNYSQMRRMFPNCRSDVQVTVTDGTPYSEVLKFLRNRYNFLSTLYPDTSFGYKGEKYQPKILRDAGIPNIVNVERFGVPPLNRKVTVTNVYCPLHKGNMNKCALEALNQIAAYFS